MVYKKDGSRFCSDYRKVNALIEDEASALPIHHEALCDLETANAFVTLDLKSEY